DREPDRRFAQVGAPDPHHLAPPGRREAARLQSTMSPQPACEVAAGSVRLPPEPMFVDSHCHLDFPELAADIDGILERMAAASVDEALCVSVTMAEFPRVLELAGHDERLWASVGVHPDNPPSSDPADEPDCDQLLRLADHPKVLAIGETGLDYFRQTEDAPWQRERFRQHIRASRRSGKPLIIHTRAAAADTLAIMREE